jgi:hypothetical protein
MNKYQSTGALFVRRSLHRQPSSKVIILTNFKWTKNDQKNVVLNFISSLLDSGDYVYKWFRPSSSIISNSAKA